MSGPQAALLPDGRRLHLNHGPIDLIIGAFGEGGEIEAAYGQARDRFDTVLVELVEELAALRRASSVGQQRFRHPTARRMEQAACRFAGDTFVTPMACVAGAVAEEMLSAMAAGRRLERAYVNNGGDIAFHLSPGTSIRAAIAGTGRGFADQLEIGFCDPVRGVATSGRHGRSLSLGIADAVTVLAGSAAIADVAATLIANAVDLPGHPAVRRVPARELDPDSDLGERPVPVSVDPLRSKEIEAALESGLRLAQDFARRGLIEAAALYLGGRERFCPAEQGRTLVHREPKEVLHA